MAGFLAGEWWIRLGISAAVFAVMAGWEVVSPRRSQAIERWVRWPNNLGVVIIDTILLRGTPRQAAGIGLHFGGSSEDPPKCGRTSNSRSPVRRTRFLRLPTLD
jgi:hypothetical protein